jgi:hypothetical protein
VHVEPSAPSIEESEEHIVPQEPIAEVVEADETQEPASNVPQLPPIQTPSRTRRTIIAKEDVVAENDTRPITSVITSADQLPLSTISNTVYVQDNSM